MSGDRLTPLQWRILPPPGPAGGAALAGIYLKQRITQDLDLFWRGRGVLDPLPREAEEALRAEGLDVVNVQTGATFHRLRVSDGRDVGLVDPVAERAAPVAAPLSHEIDGVPILVDSPHEVLVNKLCALLSRSELRDVLDIKGLVESGADLDRAVADAPRKDAGISTLTLAWLLEGMKRRMLAQALNLSHAETEGVVRVHALLIERLLVSGAPE